MVLFHCHNVSACSYAALLHILTPLLGIRTKNKSYSTVYVIFSIFSVQICRADYYAS